MTIAPIPGVRPHQPRRPGLVLKILFVHQNFPGQFGPLALALVQRGHEVRALGMVQGRDDPAVWGGVPIRRYTLQRGTSPTVHPWLVNLESKTIRGEACFREALRLREEGFHPDIIMVHPGWGEGMFLHDVWPQARLGLYCEYHYQPQGGGLGFDPEHLDPAPGDALPRTRLRNLNNRLHFDGASGGLSPTRWQADTFPPEFRERISVVHEGIETAVYAPNPNVTLTFGDGLRLSREDEVVTFLSRNLEPLRGYHIFMRALPELLRRRPDARILIVGHDENSYSAAPPAGRTWKQVYLDEVRPQISDADWSRVRFLGRISRENFTFLTALSRVHVYLTYPFVLSWSVLEFMSSGCAVVASDTAPVREVITHNETGRLVDFFDINGLVDQVTDLLDHPEERARLGAAARAHMVRNYDRQTVCLPQQIAWIEALAAAPHP